MKIRNLISICLLFTYFIVVAHNVVPHHHHSQFSGSACHCHSNEKTLHPPQAHEHSHENCKHEHSSDALEEENQFACCELDHNHQNDKHVHCSFEESIVLNKQIDVSKLHILVVFDALTYNDCESTFVPFCTIESKPLDAHCRDVQLRGPPTFS